MTDGATSARPAGLPQSPRERTYPWQRPRDAATLILVDRSGPEPMVLFGKRHPGHKFMPGKFVFPGGRIEPSDRRMSAVGALNPACAARLLKKVVRPTASRARALALAAIRETFEETGLLLGARVDGPPPPAPAGPWAAFAAHGVQPALDRLHFVARAITPPNRPKRFDTRFFAAEASDVAHRVDGVVGPDTELVELVWTPLSAIGALDLPAITAIVLQDLARRIEAGFSDDLPAPFYYEHRLQRRRETI